MEWHKLVPRTIKENLQFRRDILLRAKNDKSFQNGLLEICKRDVRFFINVFVWQTNPNEGDDAKIGPFILWTFQEKAICSEDEDEPGILWCMKNGKSLVIEKSRELGATWLFLIVVDWKCRFTSYFDALMMSKSEKAVDDATRQSLFGKLRVIHEHLPRWMHDEDKFLDNKSNFVYDKTKASAKGFSSTGRAGVSERGSVFGIDEYSHITEDFEVLSRTAATSRCRIFISTHQGTGTAFYTVASSPHFKKIVFHWTQHPGKNKGMYRYNERKEGGPGIEFLRYNEETDDIELCENHYVYPPKYNFDKTGNPVGGPHPGVRSPAYDHAFEEMGRNLAEMAKEWDINPTGSVSQFYNPLVIINLVNKFARPPRQEYELEYDKETGTPVRLVEKVGGKIKLWCPLDAQGKPPRAIYGAGADISGGTGCTPSCLTISSAMISEKVLEYMDPNIRPHEFAVLCVALCRLFIDMEGNGAKLCWEHLGPGITFADTVWKTLKYMRVYFKTNEHAMRMEASDTPGWNPQGGNVLRAHGDYQQALYEQKFVNRSRHSLEETLNFKRNDKGGLEHTQYKNKKDPTAGRENHGDIVVSDMLSWKMIAKSARVIVQAAKTEARPGTLQWMWDEEEKQKVRSNERYPNWNGQRQRHSSV